jgi:2-dehydropantoate 2-reductase
MTSVIDHITILGAGALGGFYASKFYEMNKNSVCLVASGKRYERLKEKGIFVNDIHYPIKVIKPEDASPRSGLIIVALKHHHLPEAIGDIQNRVGPETIILSVMNGVESEAQIGSIYGMDKVLYCVALGIDALRKQNQVICTKQGKLLFGEADNSVVPEKVRRVQTLFDRAGLAYEIPVDMIRVLWWKFMINVGINQSSAVLRAPFNVFQTSRDARAIMESAMREVMTIAEHLKIQLTEKDIENWYAILSGINPDGKTSMLQDIEAGRKTEVEMFAGKVVELGEKYGIPTPVNQTLLRIIKVMEADLVS